MDNPRAGPGNQVTEIISRLRHSPGDLLFNLILFRGYLNSGEAMDLVGLQRCSEFNQDRFLEKLAVVNDKLGKVSNAAYNVGSFGSFADAASGPNSKPKRAAAMFAEIAQLPLAQLLQRLEVTVSTQFPTCHIFVEWLGIRDNPNKRCLKALFPHATAHVCCRLGFGMLACKMTAHAPSSVRAWDYAIGLRCYKAHGDSEATFQCMLQIRGLGAFVSYQICVDLGYWNPRVYDEAAHVHLGPGALRGLGWLFSSTDQHTPVQQIRCAADCAACCCTAFGAGQLDFVRVAKHSHSPSIHNTARSLRGYRFLERYQYTAFSKASVDPEELFSDLPAGGRRLNLMALENCLCEGDKYFRTSYGTGGFKQKYVLIRSADQQRWWRVCATRTALNIERLSRAHCGAFCVGNRAYVGFFFF